MLGNSTSVDVDFQEESLRKAPVTLESLETDRSPRHTQSDNGMQKQGLSKGRPFQLNSPTRWTNSIASEMEPGMDSGELKAINCFEQECQVMCLFLFEVFPNILPLSTLLAALPRTFTHIKL